MTGGGVACLETNKINIAFFIMINDLQKPGTTNMRQWLVAYVHSCMEKQTASALENMGIDHFLPVQTEVRQWSDRKKKVQRLIIPMMIFLHVSPRERSIPLGLSAISRYLVLRGEHTPAIIPDDQMERFRFMLDYSPQAVEFCATPLSPGDAVRVIKGPLAGLEGELIYINGKSAVAIRLNMLGCATVEMSVGFIEKKTK